MSAHTLGRREPSITSKPLEPVSQMDMPFEPHIRIDGRRLSLRSSALFDAEEIQARRFIDRVFALDQVESVVVRRERKEINVELVPLADPEEVWSRLGALIRRGGADVPSRASRLDLRGPTPRLPVRIARAGNILTTFRARVLSHEHLRIGHPQLRDRGIRRKFIDMLGVVHGVSAVRAAGFRPVVVVTYDPVLIDAEHILRLIEGAWPEIVGGAPVPSTPRKLFVAAGLLVFSCVAQYFSLFLLPWATAAVVLYSLPNVMGAIRELAHGRIGLYTLYSTGLGFLLWSRLPFASSVMATFGQLWPALAQKLASKGEKNLFVEHRRRLAWARLDDTGQGEILVGLQDLIPGSRVVARAGDFLPADGVVVDGHAVVEEDMLSGARGAVDRMPGDPVYAGTFVRDGIMTLEVRRTGPATAAAALVRALPHGALKGLPSSAEAERIANRNAKPALAAAAVLLLATQVPRFSQVVIRPDYATAPRLSAHLSALAALAQALSRGALFRHPAALDLLSSVEAFVFDDDMDFTSRAVVVKKVNVVRRAAGSDALGLAAAALAGYDDPRADALKRELDEFGLSERRVQGRRRRAGETVFWDDAGALVSVANPAHALRESSVASSSLRALIERLAADPAADPAERALVVARNHQIIGVLQFARRGELRFAEAIGVLRRQYPEARFIHISSTPQAAAEAAAEGLGLDAVFGDLDAREKAHMLRSLGMRVAWIGNGADRDGAAARAASAVSISLGGLEGLARDEADIVLLRDDLRVLIALRSAVDAHVGRLEADYRVVYCANLFALAGGFAAGFGGLGVGLISNLGSALVFLRRWRHLVGLSAEAMDRAGIRIGSADVDAISPIALAGFGADGLSREVVRSDIPRLFRKEEAVVGKTR